MKDNLLEVGDVLFDTDRWSGIIKYVIDKVTPKQAFSGSRKFLREIVMSKDFFEKKEKQAVKLIGEYGYAYLSTPEWVENYELQKLKKDANSTLQSVNTSLLNKEQCLLIISTLSPMKDLSKIK